MERGAAAFVPAGAFAPAQQRLRPLRRPAKRARPAPLASAGGRRRGGPVANGGNGLPAVVASNGLNGQDDTMSSGLSKAAVGGVTSAARSGRFRAMMLRAATAQTLTSLGSSHLCSVESALALVRRSNLNERRLARIESVLEILQELQMDNEIVVAGVLRGLPVSMLEIEQRFGSGVIEVIRRDQEFRQLLTSSTMRSGGSSSRTGVHGDAVPAPLSLFSLLYDLPCLVIELAHSVAWLRHLPPPTMDASGAHVDDRLSTEDLDAVVLSAKGGARRRYGRKELLDHILRVHVPLADWLGCFALQSELEELAFLHLNPEAYAHLCVLVGKQLERYGSVLGETIRELECTLSNLPQFRQVASFRVSGRIKNCFSIYQKMLRKRLAFEEILDFVALRVILKPKRGVSEECACDRVMREVQRRYDTVDGTLHDYIRVPKDNGYQSLHITVNVRNLPLEIQVRTEHMHECSEYGSAAHHSYKNNVLL